VEIVMQLHKAEVTDAMRARIEKAVATAAKKLPRAVDAQIHLEQDGKIRRVEIILHASRHPSLVAKSEGAYFGPLVTATLRKLSRQMAKEKGAPVARSRAARNRVS
jgi:ribosome-associated translation inhibitor RaiA